VQLGLYAFDDGKQAGIVGRVIRERIDMMNSLERKRRWHTGLACMRLEVDSEAFLLLS
jgi:hypothetical protein